MKISTPAVYRFLLVAVLVALTVPRMTARGMFGDGLLYATIARNMSLGVGSFWKPALSATSYIEFYEHPPLGLALQSLAFRAFGDHFAVERVYAVFVFGVHAFLIAMIWRRLQPPELDWLPLLFWILPSIVTWAAVNNMLENTQATATTAAVLVMLVAEEAPSRGRMAVWSLAAAGFTIAAVLIKGPVGFFPFAVPFVLLLTSRYDRARTTLIAVTLAAGVGAGAVALAAYGPARQALSEYVQLQLVPSLQGEREINGDPLATVRHLGLGVTARMAIVCCLFWLFGRRATRLRWTPATLFFGIALCASLPIAVSPKLAGHYFLPSVPFFALGFASLAAAPASRLLSPTPGWHRRIPALLGATLLVASIVVPVVHGSIEPRDEDMLRNLDLVGAEIPRGITIGSCRESADSWSLQSYVNRFFRVSLDPRGEPVNGLLLQDRGACQPPPECRVAVEGDRLVLFRCATTVGLVRRQQP